MQASLPSAGNAAEAHGAHVDVVVDCDAAVIGSGAGGGVSAAVLAAAGQSVVVIEKGSYTHPERIPQGDLDALARSYECGITASAADSGLAILAGSGAGGGTRVNWCASFRTPQAARHEWAKHHGLDFVTGTQFDEALDVVCARLRVHGAPAMTKDAAAAKLHEGFKARICSMLENRDNCAAMKCKCFRFASTAARCHH